MRIRTLILGVATATVFAVAQAGAEAQPPAAAHPATGTWTAPPRAAHKRNPLPEDTKIIATGKILFTQNCLPCHGSLGNGDGPAAAFLDKKPGVLSDPKMWHESDGALFWKITNGNTPMPSFRPTLSEEQRWQVIEYIRTLAPKPADYVAEAAEPAKPAKKAAAAEAKPERPAGNPEVTGAQSPAIAAEMQAMKREIEALKEDAKARNEKADQVQEENAQAVENLENDLTQTKIMAKDAYPGNTKMLIVGYGTAGYTGKRTGDGAVRPVFDAAFNPLMIWKFNDKLFFEGEIELEMEGTETTLNLEVAQSTYLFSDYMSLGAGKFLNPMNFFVERQHMNWVNKMVDKPLAVYDGLIPESELGVQLRGVLPILGTKLEYAAFTANATRLITDDSTAYGSMEFNDFDNVNGNLALGGRVGFIPAPQFEIGYGMMTSEVGPAGTKIRALLQSLDVNYIQDAEAIRGIVAVRGQWVWSQVDKVTYDPDGALGFGPKTFDNFRQGGYAQVAYRPAKLKVPVLKDLEPAFRWDAFYQKKTPVGFDEQRLAFGLNYWIQPNVVAKGTYEIDHQNGIGQNADVFMAQFITGF